MVDITDLNRVISESDIDYMIFEQKLKGAEGRALQVERRARRRASKLVYLSWLGSRLVWRVKVREL